MQDKKSKILSSAIEEDILSGRYSRGFRLEEEAVARQYGVSRTPVREAFVQLAASGLVEFHPKRGVFVAGPEPRDILEMFELRSELEGICGRLAAHRGTPESLLALGRALHDCEIAAEQDDLSAYHTANDRFHAAIYAMSGNRLLEENVSALYRQLNFLTRTRFREAGRMGDSLTQHRAIFLAISTRDFAEAERALKHHVMSRGASFLSIYRSLFEPETLANAEGQD